MPGFELPSGPGDPWRDHCVSDQVRCPRFHQVPPGSTRFHQVPPWNLLESHGSFRQFLTEVMMKSDEIWRLEGRCTQWVGSFCLERLTLSLSMIKADKSWGGSCRQLWSLRSQWQFPWFQTQSVWRCNFTGLTRGQFHLGFQCPVIPSVWSNAPRWLKSCPSFLCFITLTGPLQSQVWPGQFWEP